MNAVVDEAMKAMGYSSCKPVNILQGLDVFINVPTGYCKSAIFQVLPGCGQILVDSDSHSSPKMLNSVVYQQTESVFLMVIYPECLVEN